MNHVDAELPEGAFSSLQYLEFRCLILVCYLLTAAILIQEVALGYEIYRMTGDPLALGLIGLAEALPFMGLALFGGHWADNREKRGLMQASLLTMLVASTCLWGFTELSEFKGSVAYSELVAIYALLIVLGLARGIYSPTTAALKAFLVPRKNYANASTWYSAAWQAGAITGPVIAGVLLVHVGFGNTLLVVMGLLAAAILMTYGIRRRPIKSEAEDAADLWTSLREGLDYVRRSPIILYSISLDMISVLFGGVLAILPVFAQDILAAGPEGLGLLRAAPAIGAMGTMLLMLWYPPVRQAWRNLLFAVAGFGIATLVFALSENLWLSAFALFLTGAFDSVSVVIRGTILQMMTPDHLRGRVQSVNSVFLSASNELGAFESGLAARLMGTVPSVLFGAGMTFLAVGYLWKRSKALFKIRL